MHDQDYSIEEAAALMQAPVETVRLWVSKKLLGAYELGRGWRISSGEIEAILQARRRAPAGCQPAAGEGAPFHPA